MHQLYRYAFRSPEKVALQEIGPRFTLKLRYLKKGLPAVKNLGAPSKPLEFDAGEEDEPEPTDAEMKEGDEEPIVRKEVVPPTEDEYLWMWKVGLGRSPHLSSSDVLLFVAGT